MAIPNRLDNAIWLFSALTLKHRTRM